MNPAHAVGHGIHEFFRHITGVDQAEKLMAQKDQREAYRNAIIYGHQNDDPDAVLGAMEGLASISGKYGKEFLPQIQQARQQLVARRQAQQEQAAKLNVNLTGQPQPQLPGGVSVAAPAGQPESRSVMPGVIGLEMPTVPPPPAPPPGSEAKFSVNSKPVSPGMQAQPVMNTQAVPMPSQPQFQAENDPMMGTLPGGNLPGFTGAGGVSPTPPPAVPNYALSSAGRNPQQAGEAAWQKFAPTYRGQQQTLEDFAAMNRKRREEIVNRPEYKDVPSWIKMEFVEKGAWPGGAGFLTAGIARPIPGQMTGKQLMEAGYEGPLTNGLEGLYTA
ncbi:MAG TPA: hypothetical protein VIM84_05850, partial [Gemmatimonadales bacterium]